MSELVAPYSKKHLYLVLHQYNDDPEGRPQLARAQVIKDSSFFPASTSTYIAAEAFRISLFGNPESGYAYRFIPQDWFIAAEVDDEEKDKDTRVALQTNTMSQSFDLKTDTLDKNILLTALHTKSGTEKTLDETSDLGVIWEAFANDFNAYSISTGTLLEVPKTPSPSETEKVIVKLNEKPSEKLSGPGFGLMGIGFMRGEITSYSPDGWTDFVSAEDGTPELTGVVFEVEK